MTRFLAPLLAVLVSSTAWADNAETCKSVSTRPIAYAMCLAKGTGATTRCNGLDSPYKETCLAVAAGSTTPCNRITNTGPKKQCEAIVRGKVGDCSPSDAPPSSRSWCKAIVNQDAGLCSSAGDMKVECQALAGVLPALVLGPPPTTTGTTTTTTETTPPPTVTRTETVTTTESPRTTETTTTTPTVSTETTNRLKQALGEQAWGVLSKDLEVASLEKLEGKFGAARLKTLSAKVPGKDFTALLTTFGDATKLESLATQLTDDRFGSIGAKTLVKLGTSFTDVDELAKLLADLDASKIKAIALQDRADERLKAAADLVGGAAQLNTVLKEAAAKSVWNADLLTFLDACVADGWKKPDELVKFVGYHAASGDAMQTAIDNARTLIQASEGNATAYNGRSAGPSSEVHSVALKDKTNADVTLTFCPPDTLHVWSRHTWSGFATDPGAVKGSNSMFPTSVDKGGVEALAEKILGSTEVKNAVAGMGAGEYKWVELTVDGYNIRAGVNLGTPMGVVTFFPLSGTGVIDMKKQSMLGALSLLRASK